MYIHSNLRI